MAKRASEEAGCTAKERGVTEGRPALCIFAKAPEAGQVKTRLAAACGNERAQVLAEAFLEDTLLSAATFNTERLILAWSGERSLLPSRASSFEVWDQGTGDLGERMERVMASALLESPFVIALGSDSPGLSWGRIRRACELLQEGDAVLGPAEDGGFYLLGLKRCPPGILQDLPWSQDNTAESTLLRLKEWGCEAALLPPWFDVDTEQDLAKLSALIVSGEVSAPYTEAVLFPSKGRS